MAEDAIFPSGTDADRKQLRRALREQRAALPAARRLAAAEALPNQLVSFAPARVPGYVGGYWAVNGELPLHVLQLRLAPGQVWCLPLLQGDNHLRFAPWRPGDPLVTNRYGIPEPDVAAGSTLAPEDLQLVLVPLLGFDRRGQRMGMGGGYYDRSFAFRHKRGPAPWLLGVGYAEQELAEIVAEPWDVALDAVATDRELILSGAAANGR